MVYKQQNASHRVRSGHNTTKEMVHGEATECRLCKHCGWMLNADYADQKQE